MLPICVKWERCVAKGSLEKRHSKGPTVITMMYAWWREKVEPQLLTRKVRQSGFDPESGLRTSCTPDRWVRPARTGMLDCLYLDFSPVFFFLFSFLMQVKRGSTESYL